MFGVDVHTYEYKYWNENDDGYGGGGNEICIEIDSSLISQCHRYNCILKLNVK